MRLIDADALFSEFENAKWHDNNDRDLVAEDILMDAQTIYAIEVVRCKDCKSHHNDNPELWCGRFDGGIGTSDNDYCSDGERREPEGRTDESI